MKEEEKRVIDAAKGISCTLRECVTGDINCGVDIVTRDPVAARLVVDAITRLDRALEGLAQNGTDGTRGTDDGREEGMGMIARRVRLRARYWWRKACNAFGFCPCGSRVNWTTKGRPICPSCGR